MNKISLAALLDEDREMVLANIARDRSLPAAQAALEKEIDRVMYRYVEACGDGALRDSAQHILQAMKDTLPLMNAVDEAREWKQTYVAPGRDRGLRLGGLTALCLVAGLALVLASVAGVLIAGRLTGALTFLKALLPAALGCAALFLAGVRAARAKRAGAAQSAPEAVRTEFMADGEKTWHLLRGAMLLADGQLERIREQLAAAKESEKAASPAGAVPAAALELFSELLESAYAAGSDAGREQAEAIRFYLHRSGIEVCDYVAGRESWFEFLPAGGAGTIRPALVTEGRLLKKGLAAAAR